MPRSNRRLFLRQVSSCELTFWSIRRSGAARVDPSIEGAVGTRVTGFRTVTAAGFWTQAGSTTRVCDDERAMPGSMRRARALRSHSKVMFETKALMSQVASESVWLVIALPRTVKFLKWTPLMFTVDDIPCRPMTFFASELTLVK